MRNPSGQIPSTPRPLSTDERDKLITSLTDSAIAFVDEELKPARLKMWDYYNGKVDFPAQKRRSRVVRPEVRDIVEMLMPPLMAVFASVPNVVEFVPRTNDEQKNEAQNAATTTAEINDLFYNANSGWVVLHDAVKDTLLNRIAAFKVYDEPLDEDEMEDEEGDELDEIAAEPEVPPELLSIIAGESLQPPEVMPGAPEVMPGAPEVMPGAPEMMPEPVPQPAAVGHNGGPPLDDKKVIVEVVPPEELIIDRQAKDADGALIIGQRKKMRYGDLVAMGFSLETLQRLTSASDAIDGLTDDPQARTQVNVDSETNESQWALREVELREVYVRMDVEGNGKLKRYKALVIGTTVLECSEVEKNYQPFVIFNSVRVPHSILGRSPGEHGKELQDVGTALFRQVLDNLYWANSPALGVLTNAVNPYQVDNWSFGSKIDQKVPDAVQVYTIPFVADKALSFFGWLDQQREQRTGVYKDAMGLNPDAIKGASATAAQGSFAAAQRQIEMYARVIGETGIAPMFRKMYFLKTGRKLAFNVSVRVGLGTGTTVERLTSLMVVAQKQEQVILTLGKDNPVCSLAQYSYTLREIAKLSPYYDVSQMFSSPEAVEAALEQAKQKPPEPSPEMAKVQGELQIKQQESMARMQGEQQKQQFDLQMQQVKAQQETQMAALKAQQESEIQRMRDQAALQLEQQKSMSAMQLEREKTEMQARITQMESMHSMQLKTMEAEHKMALAEAELKIEARLEEKKINAQTKDGQGTIPNKD